MAASAAAVVVTAGWGVQPRRRSDRERGSAPVVSVDIGERAVQSGGGRGDSASSRL